MYPKLIKLDFDLSRALEVDYSATNSCLFHQKYEQTETYKKYGDIPESYCDENTSIHQVWWDVEDFEGIEEIGKQLNIDVKGLSTIKQDPGNFIPIHKDIFKKIKDKYDTTGKKIVRANIHINEWSPGQIIQYENKDGWKNFSNWEVGQGLLFDDTCLHVGMNGSLKPKYTMQISGFYNGKVI